MLFTFLTSLLISCLIVLLVAWICDVVSNWSDAGNHEALPRIRSVSGCTRGINQDLPPVRADRGLQGGLMVGSTALDERNDA